MASYIDNDNVVLIASDLCDKGGFYDGDIFDDFWWHIQNHLEVCYTHDFSNGPPQNSRISLSDATYKAIEYFLLPLIEIPVELKNIVTCHNNVRIEIFDGKSVHDLSNEEYLALKDILSSVKVVVNIKEIEDFFMNLLEECQNEN